LPGSWAYRPPWRFARLLAGVGFTQPGWRRTHIDRGCAQSVVVSLGDKGAVLATPNGGQRHLSVLVTSGIGVGAGDAMLAGITVGLSRAWPLAKALQLGIAAGQQCCSPRHGTVHP
jgi:fructose-1-phosphate kinase PfkB-like protein